MILCDLPYGTTACKWDFIIPFESLWTEYERVIKDDGAIVLTAIQPFTSALIMSNPKLFRTSYVWDKKQSVNFVQAKNHPLKRTEDIVVFGKKRVNYYPQMIERTQEEFDTAVKKRGTNKGTPISDDTYTKMASGVWKSTSDLRYKYPTNILEFSSIADECNPKHKVHPTQKPVALFEYLIKTYSNEGDVILDNCIGSGTTAVAAINTGRQFIGTERETEYCEIARQRIEDALQTKINGN